MAAPQVAVGDGASRVVAGPAGTLSQTDEGDRAAIGHAVQNAGIPPEQVAQLNEAFLNAYTELIRQAAQASAGQSPTGLAVDGIPVPVATSADVASSPASVTARNTAALHPSPSSPVGGSRSSRLATSAYSAAQESNNASGSSVPAPQVKVEPRPPADASATAAQQPAADPSIAAADVKNAAMPKGDQQAASTTGGADSVDASATGDMHGPETSWPKQINAAIEQLRSDLQSATLGEEERARYGICLSLLYLAGEEPEKAVEALQDLDEQQLEFWRQTVRGMGILLDPGELPKFRHRVESAASHLAEGVNALSSLGPLRLSNLSFCTKVDGFGDFVECSAYGLEPGKPVLLYVEVDNFTAEPVTTDRAQEGWARNAARRSEPASTSASRYVTELHGRYEILDANQRTIVSRTLPVGGDSCRNQRRDFYISYVLYMPDNIEPGAYTLELTIEDKKGGKFGNAVADFRIQ